MTDENKAKIRERLVYGINNVNGLSGWDWLERDKFDNAIKLLDSEDRPSVPMAMLVELAKHGSEAYRKDDYYDRDTDLIEIAARYGFKISE